MSVPRLEWRGCGPALRVAALEDPELDAGRFVTRGLAEMLADGPLRADAGGLPSWCVVRAQRFDPTRALSASEIGAWIGEVASGGESSGLAAAGEIESIVRSTPGSIAGASRESGPIAPPMVTPSEQEHEPASAGALLLPPLEPGSLSALLPLAARSAQVLFLIEVRDPELGSASHAIRVEVRQPLSNAVVVRVTGPGRVDLPAFISALEEADVPKADVPSPASSRAAASLALRAREIATRLLAPERRERGFEPGRLDVIAGVVESLLAWRRWQGLLRSIDLGTRALLFEHAVPGLDRRLERIVEEFLMRLARRGIVSFRRGAPRVRCRLLAEDEDGLRASIQVATRLTEPYHAALERARQAPRSPALCGT